MVVHPSDTASPLVALEARARIAGPKGRRTVPLESFFVPPAEDLTREHVLQPGELLVEVLLPPPSASRRSGYRKVRARGAWDFALAGAAVALDLTGGRVTRARVVLSGVAPVPWRAHRAEEALAGTRLEAGSAGKAAWAAAEGAEVLELNAYKVDLVRAVVADAVLALA